MSSISAGPTICGSGGQLSDARLEDGRVSGHDQVEHTYPTPLYKRPLLVPFDDSDKGLHHLTSVERA